MTKIEIDKNSTNINESQKLKKSHGHYFAGLQLVFYIMFRRKLPLIGNKIYMEPDRHFPPFHPFNIIFAFTSRQSVDMVYTTAQDPHSQSRTVQNLSSH